MVSVGVVDEFEVVEIGHDDRERPVVTLRSLNFSRQLHHEVASVVGLEQRIGRSQNRQLRMRLAQRPLETDDAATRLEARQQLAFVGRFLQVVVGAGVQSRNDVGARAVAGQKKDVEISGQACLASAATQCDAVHLGHLPVGDEKLDLALEEARQRLLAISRSLHAITGTGQQAVEQKALRRLIFHQ